MKTIGLLGGMSWESTTSYYQAINRGVQAHLGGLHSAKIILNSLDFADIETLQHQGKWQQLADHLADAAKAIENAGAEVLLICTNTMHKVAPQIEQQLTIPLLHIADATAIALQQDGIKRVGLLGTKFTMEESFYKHRLSERFGMEVLSPNEDQRAIVHDVIYQELCAGIISAKSRALYLEIIASLVQRGAEAVILGCTEIALLVKPEHCQTRLYDTTAIHAQAALEFALSD